MCVCVLLVCLHIDVDRYMYVYINTHTHVYVSCICICICICICMSVQRVEVKGLHPISARSPHAGFGVYGVGLGMEGFWVLVQELNELKLP